MSRTSLDIRKTAPSGKSEAHRFNPFWARFSVARHAEIGITRMAVEAQGQNVPIGGFPRSRRSRESFATAFSRALATAKDALSRASQNRKRKILPTLRSAGMCLHSPMNSFADQPMRVVCSAL